LNNISNIKDEVRKKADESIKHFLTDRRTENFIKQSRDEELQNLDVLKTEIQNLLSMVKETENVEDIHGIVDLILEEAKKIDDRIARVTKELDNLRNVRVRANMAKTSDKVIVGRTRDGTPFSKVVKAFRQLGGVGINTRKGKHPYKVVFPNGRIPLSNDVGCQFLADDVNKLLRRLYPNKEIPDSAEIEKSLKKGSINNLLN